VDNKVQEVFSKYRESSMLQTFAESVDILLEGVPDGGALSLRRCREYETVCLSRGKKSSKDFFYFYSYLISDIHVRFPFDEFTMEVLCVLNVAPTEFHSNSRAAL